MPGLPAHLAVGDALEPDPFLQGDRVADGRVLGSAEGVGGGVSGLALEAQRLQRGRTQEAADMIGAERRPRVRHGGHPITVRATFSAGGPRVRSLPCRFR